MQVGQCSLRFVAISWGYMRNPIITNLLRFIIGRYGRLRIENSWCSHFGTPSLYLGTQLCHEISWTRKNKFVTLLKFDVHYAELNPQALRNTAIAIAGNCSKCSSSETWGSPIARKSLEIAARKNRNRKETWTIHKPLPSVNTAEWALEFPTLQIAGFFLQY